MAGRRAPAAQQRAEESGVLIRRLTIVSSRGPPELMVWLRRVHQLKAYRRKLEVHPHPRSGVLPLHGQRTPPEP